MEEELAKLNSQLTLIGSSVAEVRQELVWTRKHVEGLQGETEAGFSNLEQQLQRIESAIKGVDAKLNDQKQAGDFLEAVQSQLGKK